LADADAVRKPVETIQQAIDLSEHQARGSCKTLTIQKPAPARESAVPQLE
jgi:hypothetical protein